MKKEERNAVLVLIVAFFLGLLCTGCSAQRNEANRISYQLQTRCPNIWDETPSQEISIKMDFRR